MLIGCILPCSVSDLNRILAGADLSPYQMLELRLDGLREAEAVQAALPALKQLLNAKNKKEEAVEGKELLPLMLTLRPKAQGGLFAGTEEQRRRLLRALAALQPDALDLESTLPRKFIQETARTAPRSRLVLSCHNNESTPDDLETLLARMRDTAPEAVHKIAAMARSTPDALRMAAFCRENPEAVVGISMGPYGDATRILAPVLHHGYCYCPVAAPTAPGQLEAAVLTQVYRFQRLNRQTEIYGLIGDPVEQSVGHYFHNEAFHSLGHNGVYVKWRIRPGELAESLALLRRIGIAGLSVTMPHKETVISGLDRIDSEAQAMGAVNTIVSRDGLWTGYNTDGPGAVQALATPLQGKTVVILGAGGTAKAICRSVRQHNARIIVLNRTLQKAEALSPEAYTLDALPRIADFGCHILINTLPSEVALPLHTLPLSPEMLVMDASYGRDDSFLNRAEQAGCRIVKGLDLFQAQARAQTKLWLER